MIATIIKAEARESRASGTPYLAVTIRVEEDEHLMFIAGLNLPKLWFACHLPMVQSKGFGPYKFNTDKLKNKIISVDHERIKFKDREYDRWYVNERRW